MVFVFPSHRVVEPCCPGADWTLACPWEVVDKCLVWLCWCVWLLLYLLKSFNSSTQLFSLLPSWFSPLSHQVSERLSRAELLAGIKPQHHEGWDLSRILKRKQAFTQIIKRSVVSVFKQSRQLLMVHSISQVLTMGRNLPYGQLTF